MIAYTEKGFWLHQEIGSQGHSLWEIDGVWVSDDDVAVQAIIDTFDPLPFAKEEKINELKTEAANRASAIYSFLGNDPKAIGDFMQFAQDIYSHIPSPNALSGRLLSFKNIRDAMQGAMDVINAMTDWEAVMAYDVVNTPSWP